MWHVDNKEFDNVDVYKKGRDWTAETKNVHLLVVSSYSTVAGLLGGWLENRGWTPS